MNALNTPNIGTLYTAVYVFFLLVITPLALADELQDSAKPTNMTFPLVGNGGNCDNCEWINAKGSITKETVKVFNQRFAGQDKRICRVKIHSSKGDIDAALALGRNISKHKSCLVVANGVPYKGAYELKSGVCEGVCAYSFLAGKTRRLADGSSIRFPAPLDTFKDRDTAEAQISQYLKDIGFDVSDRLMDFIMHRDERDGIADKMFLEEIGVLTKAFSPWATELKDGKTIAISRQDAFDRYEKEISTYCSDGKPHMRIRYTHPWALDHDTEELLLNKAESVELIINGSKRNEGRFGFDGLISLKGFINGEVFVAFELPTEVVDFLLDDDRGFKVSVYTHRHHYVDFKVGQSESFKQAVRSAIAPCRKDGVLEEVSSDTDNDGNWFTQRISTIVIEDQKYSVNSDGEEYSVKRKVSYPQISKHEYIWQEKWNDLVRSFTEYEPSCEGNSSTHNAEYKVLDSINQFISLRKGISDYCIGAPHSYYTTSYYNVYIVDGELTEPVLADLFDSVQNWQQDILSLANKHMKSSDPQANLFPVKELYDQGNSNWTAERNGLVLNFGRVSGYRDGIYSALIPWQDIKHLLAEDVRNLLY